MKIKIVVKNNDNTFSIVPDEEFNCLEDADKRRETPEKETGREHFWRLPDDVTLKELF